MLLGIFCGARSRRSSVNCAGYTGKPNVDACELDRAGTLLGNTLLPQTIAQRLRGGRAFRGVMYLPGAFIPGAKIVENGRPGWKEIWRPPALARRWRSSIRPSFMALRESDTPNFSFRDPPCSFYSGTKALGEEAIAGLGQSYVWRLRIPFDEFDNKRNYLSKVQRYPKVYDNVNSISHRADFVKACLDLWKLAAPYGTYNVINPGYVTTRHVVQLIEQHLRPARKFEFWASDEEFYRVGGQNPAIELHHGCFQAACRGRQYAARWKRRWRIR